MGFLLLILVVLAVTVGAGAVLEGIAWVVLIALVLIMAAGWYVSARLRGGGRRRP